MTSLVMAAACSVLPCGQVAEAANMRVTNVAMVADGNVQFDIAWTHSWRASWEDAGAKWTNWDAAWIFVKYRGKGDPAWSHATLSSKDADHSAPAGAKIDVGLTGNRGTGVFLHRAAEGKGEWSNKGVTLKWLHKQDAAERPAEVELSVHALEMVYVPEGSFYVGSPGNRYGVFVDGSWKKGDPFIPFKVTSEDELEVAQKPGCLYGTGGIGAAHQIGPAGKLSAGFPKGYGAFYCMKYELNEGEYVAFLNQLAAAHAAARYPRAFFKPKHADTESHTITNTPGGYVTTVPERSCNWIDWEDSMAHGDWAGLRPMTEMEFEKACRGPLQPVTNEYAWGSSTVKDTDIPGPSAVPPVPYPVGICGVAERVRSGSTYWGIAAMSGHLRERAISAGHENGRLFTGACGDGVLNDDGMANVDGWPPPSSTWPEKPLVGGWGFRGGPWYGDATVDGSLQVSCRYLASCLRPQRNSNYGWRGVRQAP